MKPDHAPAVRRLARSAALLPAVFVTLAAAPALASPPAQWPEPEPVSTLHVLLLLVGAPLALALIIVLLVYVPSMARGDKYQPGLAWRNEPAWFGGPRDGVQAVDKVDPKTVEAGTRERGGASARW